MSIAPRTIVEGQPRQALPYGLFSVLTTRPEGDGRWQNGIEWETLPCAGALGTGDPDCLGTDGATGWPLNFDDLGVPTGQATPFTIWGAFKCGPAGHPIEVAQERAGLHLLAREEARAEQALWTGDLDNGGFATAATDLTVGTLSPEAAVGALEKWIGDEYGSLGVIHVDRSAASVLVANDLIKSSGNGMFTILGTPVVVGAGYPGTSPAGAVAAAGMSWAYATPALIGYRSDVFYSSNRPGDLLDRGTNDLFGLAGRNYVIGFDPCGSAAVSFDNSSIGV